MEELLRSRLVRLSALYSDATGLPLSIIGSRMLRDSSFFPRIANGDGFNVKTYDRAMCWFEENWPDTAIWPEDVERPSTAAGAA